MRCKCSCAINFKDNCLKHAERRPADGRPADGRPADRCPADGRPVIPACFCRESSAVRIVDFCTLRWHWIPVRRTTAYAGMTVAEERFSN